MKWLSGGGVLGFTFLLLVSMVMPWAVVSCEGTALIQQNAFQIASGEGEVSQELKNLTKQMGGEGEAEDKGPLEDVDGAPWMYALLLSVLLGGAAGIMLLMGKKKPGVMVGLAGGGIAFLLLLASFAISFPIETKVEEENAAKEAEKEEQAEDGGPSMGPGPDMDIELKTERKGGFWLAIISSAGIIALAGVGTRIKEES